MYIVEILFKWLNKKQSKDEVYEKPVNSYEQDEAVTCKHNFMPVDSTGEVLACTECGFVVKKKGTN